MLGFGRTPLLVELLVLRMPLLPTRGTFRAGGGGRGMMEPVAEASDGNEAALVAPTCPSRHA